MYLWRFHKNIGPEDNWTVKAFMPSEAREKGGSGLYFKEEEGSGHGSGKQMFGKRMFAGPSLATGHGERYAQRGLARFLLVGHT